MANRARRNREHRLHRGQLQVNLLRRDVWVAMRATPKRRMLGWVVFAGLIATVLVPNWIAGLLVAVAILVCNQFLANHWANLDAVAKDLGHDSQA
jgi:hypothetical protein